MFSGPLEKNSNPSLHNPWSNQCRVDVITCIKCSLTSHGNKVLGTNHICILKLILHINLEEETVSTISASESVD